MDKKAREAIARKGVARSQIVILEALLKLRQVCCDLRLIKLSGGRKGAAHSANLSELTAMLEELLEEGRKILVFSPFTSMLALIEDELRARNISYALLTGETVDRSAQVAAFQGGVVPVFLISLKAGSVGLNLTAADTVIHYDPWWNPAMCQRRQVLATSYQITPLAIYPTEEHRWPRMARDTPLSSTVRRSTNTRAGSR